MYQKGVDFNSEISTIDVGQKNHTFIFEFILQDLELWILTVLLSWKQL